MHRSPWLLLGAFAMLACTGTDPTDAPDLSKVPVDPSAPLLKRLSRPQYVNSVRDLLGSDVVVPAALEPDDKLEGLVAVGASRSTISPLGVERYERAANLIATQVFADGDRRLALVGCEPVGDKARDCVESFVRSFGPKVWRRPLGEEEVTRLTDVAMPAAAALDDPWRAPQTALSAMLQSPNFLFRAELGEPDPDRPGSSRFSSWEMASRLSYFLWNTTPDDELIAAAQRGELVSDEGLRAQAERLLSSPRARLAVRDFFSDLYRLTELDKLSKDTIVFAQMHPELGPSAREETLLGLEKLIFDEDGDFRTFFTTRRTFVNRRLAALYGIPAPSLEGFAEVVLPENGLRRGFLGQASFLAVNSHPVSTSAVLRGMFVRQTLLCGTIPSPPADVNTGLPEPSDSARTLRERNTVHLESQACAGCHSLMDPIGLAFENFDGIGVMRMLDNGGVIDPSGDLDGVDFSDPVGIANAIVEHPDFAPCFARHVYRYAGGQVEGRGERQLVEALGESFVAKGHRVRELLLDVALSPGFRRAAPQDI